MSLEGFDNIWVVKPSFAARGVGIRVEASLARISSHADSTRVVQKYLEAPLLAAGRKFDCRVWLLVTSWRPLTLWFWHGCLVRRAGVPYSLAPAELRNPAVHVTNRTLGAHLSEAHGLPVDAWAERVLPSFAAVCVAALQRAPEAADDSRARPASPIACCEVFGADLMLDAQLRPWLLELNESPNLAHHSSALKAALMAELADDLLKVVADPKFHPAAAGARADAGASVSGPVGTRIGRFEKVHDSPVQYC
ncbi:tubulin-tyrosine ligase/Tubulin polyglutamylase [Pavlovales sp. CCMP2436]|nr:tubulin-tyrosine ligase/Tubulin polyglutamylase [Pavlovales sp. CCMP2436]